jgi:hypothetical protein
MIIKKKFRNFKINNSLQIKECGEIYFSQNEMINIKIKNNNNEITAKNWGFYLTPSINVRLKKNGFKCAIIKNKQNKFFVCLVINKNKKINTFKKYLKRDKQKLVTFLSTKKLKNL